MLSILPRPLMPTPFEDHYGLTQQPFGLTLDQRFVYPSRSYTTALNEVRRALQRREGLVVVTGDIGTGKTMLCRTLLQQLETPVCVSIVLDPRVTVNDLLLHVLTDFGVIDARRPHGGGAAGKPTRHQLMRALQQFLASLIPVGAYAVLVIDEAQHLDPSVLEQLRLLLNLETEEAKLLQIVLIGLPDLTRQLRHPDMRHLDQRVARRCEVEPLTGYEVKRYIERRLSIAQQLTVTTSGIEPLQREDAAVDVSSCNVMFTSSAIRAVAAQSRGIPRLVNLLCDRALEIGYERRTHTIDARIVRTAVRRLPATGSTVPFVRATRKTVASMAAVVLLTAGLGTWAWAGHRPVLLLPAPPTAFAAVPGSDSQLFMKAPLEVKELAIVDSFDVMTTTETRAHGPRLARVALVRTADRMSLAFELTAEPRKVALRRLSATAVDVEVGPVTGPIRTEVLVPPSGVSFIRQISIRGFTAANGAAFVRARVTLQEPARGNVLVVGRVAYIDFTAAASPLQTFPEPSTSAHAPQAHSLHRIAGATPEPPHALALVEPAKAQIR